MNNKEVLLKHISVELKINTDGLHGLSHFARVEKLGHYLAESNGADLEVISLFAYTHDLGRIDDDEDIDHGIRSAEIVTNLYNQNLLNISNEQYEQLIYACYYHSLESAHSEDVTIQTCWDADRLDLWRDGIEPLPCFLHTSKAKNRETIIFARNLFVDFSF